MHLLIKSLFKVCSFFILCIPRKVHIFFGWLVGVFWFDILRIRRKVVLENLRLAFPDWTEKKIVETGRQAMVVLGQNIVDVTLLPFVNQRWMKKNIEVIGYEHVEEALRKNKGILFLGQHMGSGDLSVAFLNYLGLRVNLISKEFRSAWLNRFWFSVRGRHGTKFIPVRRSSFDILRALKKKEAVIFVNDQYMGPPLGVRTQFFGHETGTAIGLTLIAGRTKSPVVPTYTYIKEDGKSVIVFESEIPWQDQGHRDQSISYMTQVYTDKVEEIIRQHPGQWLWVHRRWKEFKD